MKDSPVFHPQDNFAKPKVPISLKLQTHLKCRMDFESILVEPEAWSETLNGLNFTWIQLLLQEFDLVPDVPFL